MAKEPKKLPETFESAEGPLPLDLYGNDIPVTGEIDRTPGSSFDRLKQRLDAVKPKAP